MCGKRSAWLRIGALDVSDSSFAGLVRKPVALAHVSHWSGKADSLEFVSIEFGIVVHKGCDKKYLTGLLARSDVGIHVWLILPQGQETHQHHKEAQTPPPYCSVNL